jgi:small redox-active disulfide protein 2
MSKFIQILGAGCPKCSKLFQNAQTAVQESGIDATVEKVSDIDVITGFDVLMTPAVVIDGEVKSVGKLLTPAEIVKLLA